MRNRYYDGAASNFDGTRFHNIDGTSTDRSIGELLRWRFQGKRAVWPASIAITQAVPTARSDNLRITMIGHATVLIQIGGLNIVTDPVWSERASPLSFAGPRRATIPGVAFDRLPKIDAILLSHNHYDHLDITTLKALHRRDAPLIVTPLGNDSIVRASIPQARISAGGWNEIFDLGHGAEAIVVPAIHWSSRTLRDRRMALWSGFLLRCAGRTIYFAGDTAYGTGRVFHDIRARHGTVDVALIPIGGYEPRWFMDAQHCDPDEAVAIAEHLGARHLIGIHWGTFNLTDEPRDEPATRLDRAAVRSSLDPANVTAAVPGRIWDFTAL